MKRSAALCFVTLFACGGAVAAPDWSKVPAKKFPVFFPGQSGLEWVMTKRDHSAANQLIEKGRTCTYCHDEDATDIGNKIVAGKPVGNLKQALDPNPPKGKPGFIPVSVQATHDGKQLWLRFEWDAPRPAAEKKADPKNEVKLTVMLDDNKVEGARQNGCWSTCHQDLRTMPEAADAAKKHARAKDLGWSDGVTKYLKESRSGGWDKLRSDADIAAALKDGKFMDLIQFRSGKGEAPVDGHVLESRHMGGGKSLVKAEGGKQNTRWVVTFERTLSAGGPGDHALAEGRLYNLGFAIHDDHSVARQHHVSLGYTLGLDNPKADINAVKQ